MKPAFLFIASLFFCSIAHSQAANDQMAQDFKDISKFGSHQSGFEGLQSYHSGNVEGSQFFSPDWTAGTVTMVSNEQFGKNYLFLYDKVRQELFIKLKDSSVVLQADKDLIGSFTLTTDKVHSFVPARTLDPSNKDNFFEVLVKADKGYSLFKLTKAKFVKADQQRDMERQAMGEVNDSFQDQITYYLIKDGVVQTVALRKNNILKSLAPAKTKASEYFDRHSDSPMDETFLIGLILYVNS